MTDIQQTLAGRSKTHGDFKSNAWVAQNIKRILRMGPNWDGMASDQKEALEVMASKIGRILSGDADTHDHWHDLAGYATLIADRLEPVTALIAKAQHE